MIVTNIHLNITEMGHVSLNVSHISDTWPISAACFPMTGTCFIDSQISLLCEHHLQGGIVGIHGTFEKGRFPLYGCQPKNRGGKTPQIMSFNRVFHYIIINHPFWGVGVPLFLETPL